MRQLNHYPILSRAIRLACENPIKPVGRNSISRFCCIITNGKQEFIGFNSYRTHPLQAKFSANDKSIHIHAEIDAIIKIIRQRAKQKGRHYNDITDLSEFSAYVARVLQDGTPGLAKPCLGCQSALAAFKISTIEWSTGL